MVVRLAFSVAINVDPQILVVDEALSVGDELFQRKCYSRIEGIKNQGATILFVSHSGTAIVELCDRALLLDGGEALDMGQPKKIVGLYQRLLYAPADAQPGIRQRILAGAPEDDTAREQAADAAGDRHTEHYFDPGLVPQSTLAYESRGAAIHSAALADASGAPVNCLGRGTELVYRYKVRFDRDARNVRFGMLVKSISGVEIGGAVSAPAIAESIPLIEAGREATVEFRFRCDLNPGTYFLNSGVTGADGLEETYLHRVLDICMFKVLPVKGDRATAFVDFGCEPRVAIAPRAEELSR
jgi:lipopolysaccharide transport system ATP-binding protein